MLPFFGDLPRSIITMSPGRIPASTMESPETRNMKQLARRPIIQSSRVTVSEDSSAPVGNPACTVPRRGIDIFPEIPSSDDGHFVPGRRRPVVSFSMNFSVRSFFMTRCAALGELNPRIFASSRTLGMRLLVLKKLMSAVW